MMEFLDKILGRKRVLVKENERLVALHKGTVLGIFGPGLQVLPNRRNSLDVSRFDLTNPIFTSVYEKALFEKLPDVAEHHLTVFRTDVGEVVVIERDGAIYAILRPSQKLVVWTEAGPWKETRIDAARELAVDPILARRLVLARKVESVVNQAVLEGQVGLLFVDGSYMRMLEPGTHSFWNIGKALQVKIVDLKRQSLDVAGQELLTKDRVTIRVN
ncbi:MAG: slipin family protein, partial [Rhizobiaceae bacterium]|nr:slipin family protein [Rhizobiaceae bacterium]